MLTTVLIFVLILGLLVFVHELGHFLVAKKSGMKVDEFGFGFPPRIAGIQKLDGKWVFVWGHKPPKDSSKTVYSINLIPLGGFVKIVGENNESEDDPQSFVNKPFFPRLFTLTAGVLMNVLLAWVLFTIGFASGLPVAVDEDTNVAHGGRIENSQVAILEVRSGGAADDAGIEPNDIVLRIAGTQIENIDEVKNVVEESKGLTLEFEVKRGGDIKQIQVSVPEEAEEGSGLTGITLAKIGLLKYPWYWAVVAGITATFSQLWQIVVGIYSIFTAGVGFDSLGGPAKIAQLTGEVAHLGFIYLLQFTAFLSLNLAILNILPFPALDGGRVMFLLIEKIRGKRNNQSIEQIANTAGFLLLLLLMVLVTINDIRGFGGVGSVVNKLFGG